MSNDPPPDRHTRAASGVQSFFAVGPIDRKKHLVDVMERVLGPVRDSADVHTAVVALDTHAWLAGTLASAVQVTVGGVARTEASKPRAQARSRRRR